jgi:hypothetical protein
MRAGGAMTSYDFQAGGINQNYGRIALGLAGRLWQRFPDVTVNIKVGPAYRHMGAVGDRLAQIGVATPTVSARLCLDGKGTCERPRAHDIKSRVTGY